MSENNNNKFNVAEMENFFTEFDYKEVMFVMKKFREYYEFFKRSEEAKMKARTRNIHVLNIDDPEYPDMYRLCLEDKKPSKNNEILQNGKYYNVVRTITVPIEKDCKKIMRSLTNKIPEKGRMKYNWAFHKDRIDEIVEALEKK